jgi:ABC-type sugar transport system ATPase subunit
MLVARGISKAFGVVQALDSVDFEIGRCEVVALAGENGSGKSTLARALAGAHSIDAGEITIDGEPVTFGRPRDALDRGIALVAQEPTAVPELSVAENVLLTRLPRVHRRFSRGRTAEQAKPLLAMLGISCDPKAAFASLKAGDRELVEVAKALAASPRILILDEATSRLAEPDVKRLFEVVHRLKEEGTSTILITHRLPEIVELADRAVVLRDGRLVGQLLREEITEERLSAMMVGRELKDFFHKRQVERGDVVLELDDLVFDGASAPVSFALRAGEVLGLHGLVGCGRTELLETIAGARRPRSGRVLVSGREVKLSSPRSALEAGIALVPEERHRQGLVLGATLRENVALGSWKPLALARGWRERAMSRQAIADLRIRASGVDVAVRTLSGGNQQKVVIARGLRRSPRVLLLDEPTRGIDVGAKEEVFQIIGRMLEGGAGILLVSSDMLEILGLADRVIVLHERRVVGELTRAEATEERLALLSAGGRGLRTAA